MIAKFSLAFVCPITVHLDSLTECIHVFTNLLPCLEPKLFLLILRIYA